MRNKQEVERRVKILDFWKEHGTKAAEDAFGVSERTLYRWQAELAKNGGNLNALDPWQTRLNLVLKEGVGKPWIWGRCA